MFITPVRVPTLKTVDDFRLALEQLELELPCDDQSLTAQASSPLAGSLSVGSLRIGNRWCIHPMEGWDGTPEASPANTRCVAGRTLACPVPNCCGVVRPLPSARTVARIPASSVIGPRTSRVFARSTKQRSRLISRSLAPARRMIGDRTAADALGKIL